MQAGHSQGYELTTTALAVSILDRFAATQYLQVKTSHWLLHGHDGQSQAKVSKDCLHVQNSASQQSRRFSTVDLKSLSDLLSVYLLLTVLSQRAMGLFQKTRGKQTQSGVLSD